MIFLFFLVVITTFATHQLYRCPTTYVPILNIQVIVDRKKDGQTKKEKTDRQ